MQLINESKYRVHCCGEGDLHAEHVAGLNVVRMIKLFGWEARVAERIKSRREAELAFLRKTKFLELTNNIIK